MTAMVHPIVCWMLELNKRIRKEDREREKLSLLRLSLFIERQQRRKMNLTTVYIPFFSSSPLSCADKKSAAVLLLINFQSVNNYWLILFFFCRFTLINNCRNKWEVPSKLFVITIFVSFSYFISKWLRKKNRSEERTLLSSMRMNALWHKR